MKRSLLVLAVCLVSCQWNRKPEQTAEIVRQSENREVLDPLKGAGTEHGVVTIKPETELWLGDYPKALKGRVVKGNESTLYVHKMMNVELEGKKRLRVQFDEFGPELTLPIKARYKSGKVKVQTVLTINNKSVNAVFYVQESEKDWDVSLGRYVLDHNYKVKGETR